MPEDELTALLLLNRIEGLGCVGARLLYDELGSAMAVFEHREKLPEMIPGVKPDVVEALGNASGYLGFVHEELDFMNDHGVTCTTIQDYDYPARLRECHDAPLVLFSLGNADLSARRIVGVVGTRKITPYGQKMCRLLVKELHQLCPDAIIVSGMAYGTDIEAHKTSVECGAPTVGVLAHGLDMIYPQNHRDIAKMMVKGNGSLVTEFMSRTKPLKDNFVRRNRIIAALSDAVVIVESAAKGGSLITAEYADGYNRECFAFPGSVGDPYSVGCNELIRDNRASLITCALDLVTSMNWIPGKKNRVPATLIGTDGAVNPDGSIQKQLFIDEVLLSLTPEERTVYDRIYMKAQGVHVNQLIVDCNIPYSRIMSILLNLELRGLVRGTAGSFYKRV